MIYHDQRHTYIKTNAPVKLSMHEMKDGKSNLITVALRESTSFRRSLIMERNNFDSQLAKIQNALRNIPQ